MPAEEAKHCFGIKASVDNDLTTSFDMVREVLSAKPSHLTKKSLKKALSKPDEQIKKVKTTNKVDGRKGRTAYKLDVYKERTRLKILDLETRMAVIGNKKNVEWQRLRK